MFNNQRYVRYFRYVKVQKVFDIWKFWQIIFWQCIKKNIEKFSDLSCVKSDGC